MPRKVKTRSAAVSGRAALNLCKIDTSKIRALSTKQLESAIRKVGPIYALPKKEGHNSFRWMLSAFMSDIVQARKTPVTVRDVTYTEYGWTQKNAPGYFERNPTSASSIDWKDRTRFNPEVDAPPVIARNKQHKAMYENMAEGYERKIWDLQAQAGCKLHGNEVVARDAEREGNKEIAAKIRAERRGKPTPHKRPPKIR